MIRISGLITEKSATEKPEGQTVLLLWTVEVKDDRQNVFQLKGNPIREWFQTGLAEC